MRFKDWLIVPWIWVWGIVIFIIIVLSLIVLYLKRRHFYLGLQKIDKENLPSDIQKQLKELREYQKKYGKHIILLILIGISLVLGQVASAEQLKLGPPIITTISADISNEEIFYVGGKTEAANTEIIIYLQNLNTGETLSNTIKSDKRGEWFYTHNTFLSSGNYLLWTQSKIGDELSPPSPQVQLTVRTTALQFGASRLSFEAIYLVIVIILSLIILGFIAYICHYSVKNRRKHKQFVKEVKEAEESVRRGFGILRRDIQAELMVIKKAKLSKAISDEEKEKEAQLLKDLDYVEKYIGKEIWDIEETEHVD